MVEAKVETGIQRESLEGKIIDDPFVSGTERITALRSLLLRHDEPESDGVTSKVDLHLHTNYSDGYWTPTGLVLESYRNGMELISLTDHDGFAGIGEVFGAIMAVKELTGKKIGFVPGIEISTNYFYGTEQKKKEVHVLGYFPSEDLENFEKHLEGLTGRDKAYFEAFRKNRTIRIYEMVNKFNSELPSQVPVLAKVREMQDPIISDKTVTRGLRNSVSPGRGLTSTGIYQVYNLYMNGRLDEITDETFSTGYLEALKELFKDIDSPQALMKEFFDKKKPSAKTGYIGLAESPEWAVKTILSMGGIPVLAHPIRYVEQYKDILSSLVPAGLNGIEVFSGHCKERSEITDLLNFVKSTHPQLFVTMGSDCHGISIDGRVDYTPHNPMGLKSTYGVDTTAYADQLKHHELNPHSTLVDAA